jgi:anti-sigma factor RsiW
LEIDGFPLIGGRVDQLNGRKVAVLVYQRRKHLINLFIEITTVDTPQAEFVRWDRRGYHVVTTQQGDFVYSAVSDLSSDELEKFLQLIQAKN